MRVTRQLNREDGMTVRASAIDGVWSAIRFRPRP
jgi:hypothetical protein